MKNLVNVYKLGKIDYKKCLNIQKYLVKNQLNNENENLKDSILLGKFLLSSFIFCRTSI